MKLEGKVSVVLVSYLVLAATFAHQEEYTIVDFAENSVKHRSFQELTATFDQKKFDHLKYFECSHFDSGSLWTKNLSPNVEEDSLRVKGDNGLEYTYYQGVFYNPSGKQVKNSVDTYLNKVSKAFEKLLTLPSGKRLLQELQQAPHTVVIAQGGNRLLSKNQNDAGAIQILKTGYMRNEPMGMTDIGSAGTILINLKSESSLVESDYKTRTVPQHVLVGHELFHAYDMVRGLIDRRYLSGGEYESAELAEYRAVFFENQIRKESHLKYRLAYGQKTKDFEDSVDMLDKNGQPIWIPTVCLN